MFFPPVGAPTWVDGAAWRAAFCNALLGRIVEARLLWVPRLTGFLSNIRG